MHVIIKTSVDFATPADLAAFIFCTCASFEAGVQSLRTLYAAGVGVEDEDEYEPYKQTLVEDEGRLIVNFGYRSVTYFVRSL